MDAPLVAAATGESKVPPGDGGSKTTGSPDEPSDTAPGPYSEAVIDIDAPVLQDMTLSYGSPRTGN